MSVFYFMLGNSDVETKYYYMGALVFLLTAALGDVIKL